MNGPPRIPEPTLGALRAAGLEAEARGRMAGLYGRMLEELGRTLPPDAAEQVAGTIALAAAAALQVRAVMEDAERMHRSLVDVLDGLRQDAEAHPRKRQINAALAEVELLSRPRRTRKAP